MVKLESWGLSGGNKYGSPMFGTTPGAVAGVFPLTWMGRAPFHSFGLKTPSMTGGVLVYVATMNCLPGIAVSAAPCWASALVDATTKVAASRIVALDIT